MLAIILLVTVIMGIGYIVYLITRKILEALRVSSTTSPHFAHHCGADTAQTGEKTKTECTFSDIETPGRVEQQHNSFDTADSTIIRESLG